MNAELLEVLSEQTLETLLQWQEEALAAVRAGDYITSAATGGGVQYAKARAISPLAWLSAIRLAIKQKQQPAAVQTVVQCTSIVFTATRF